MKSEKQAILKIKDGKRYWVIAGTELLAGEPLVFHPSRFEEGDIVVVRTAKKELEIEDI